MMKTKLFFPKIPVGRGVWVCCREPHFFRDSLQQFPARLRWGEGLISPVAFKGVKVRGWREIEEERGWRSGSEEQGWEVGGVAGVRGE